MGFALGVVGMAYEDFCRLSPGEFREVCKAFQEQREAEEQARWERTRMLAAIVLMPHLKRKITPQRLIPLPWDRKTENRKDKPVSAAESKRRMEAMLKLLGDQS